MSEETFTSYIIISLCSSFSFNLLIISAMRSGYALILDNIWFCCCIFLLSLSFTICFPISNMFIFLILVTYVPILSTFLPTSLMGPEIITK